MRGGSLRITLRRIDPRSDGRGTHVDGVEVLLGLAQQLDLALQGGRKCVKFLSYRHRHGILQLGAAHLDDIDVGIALCSK